MKNKYCEYEIWDKKMGFIPCGEKAIEITVPKKFKSKTSHKVCLCEKHREFVSDALDCYSVEKTKAEMKKEVVSLLE